MWGCWPACLLVEAEDFKGDTGAPIFMRPIAGTRCRDVGRLCNLPEQMMRTHTHTHTHQQSIIHGSVDGIDGIAGKARSANG